MNNQYITEPFTLCISYSSMITPFSEQGATIKDKINFTPATLIYNNSIPSSLSDYTLYLKNENTNTIYKLSKRDTLFGFFVNPSQIMGINLQLLLMPPVGESYFEIVRQDLVH